MIFTFESFWKGTRVKIASAFELRLACRRTISVPKPNRFPLQKLRKKKKKESGCTDLPKMKVILSNHVSPVHL